MSPALSACASSALTPLRREIDVGVPDVAGRVEILKIKARGMALAQDVDLEQLGRDTHGWEKGAGDQQSSEEKNDICNCNHRDLSNPAGEDAAFLVHKCSFFFFSLPSSSCSSCSLFPRPPSRFVGADLAQLCTEAALGAIHERLPWLDLDADAVPPRALAALAASQAHFRDALKLCKPSALRETRVEAPAAAWGDVGGLEDVKRELHETVQ